MRDVAAIQAFHARRERARAALALRAEHGDAVEAHQRAAREAEEAARRARLKLTEAQHRAARVEAQADQAEGDLERVLAAVPVDLADAYREAEQAWRTAAGELRAARAEAGGFRRVTVGNSTIDAPPACDAATLKRLEHFEAQARKEADAALAAVLDHEPDVAALNAPPSGTGIPGHQVAREWGQSGPVPLPMAEPEPAPMSRYPTPMESR
ncbi:MAG: hypothetical protein M9894_14845 [Planctomycetes bacterium]|nr:hypothetical protein [Planctomycetota bacterium]